MPKKEKILTKEECEKLEELNGIRWIKPENAVPIEDIDFIEDEEDDE